MEGLSLNRPRGGRNVEDLPLDRAIGELAARQHGVVALGQLVELGLSASAVRNRVAGGRLHRIHRGVYAVGYARLTRDGRFMAAILACGPAAAISYRTAAVTWSLGMTMRRLIDVTAGASTRRDRPGIRVHSAHSLAPRDVILIDGIPRTTVARTLLDVAEDGTRRELERACDRAAIQRLLDMAAVDDVLARADGRRGAPILAAVLAEHRVGSTLTRNDLEERFLQIARDAGLAPDAVNRWIPFPEGGGAEADFIYKRRRLIVEVDGRDPHTTRQAFEADRRRDQQLTLLGWRVIRFTWRQVMHDPRYVAATLHALLVVRP
jgi:very-short-patch-repair endonuclease/predicted transcriptional regulator of viral defense system